MELRLSQIDENGLVISETHYSRRHSKLLGNLLTKEKFPSHSGIAFPKDIFTTIGGYDRRFELSEDKDLFLRLADCGSFTTLKEVLVTNRVRRDRLTNTLQSGFTMNVYSISASIKYLLKQDGIFLNDKDLRNLFVMVDRSLKSSVYGNLLKNCTPCVAPIGLKS